MGKYAEWYFGMKAIIGMGYLGLCGLAILICIIWMTVSIIKLKLKKRRENK